MSVSDDNPDISERTTDKERGFKNKDLSSPPEYIYVALRLNNAKRRHLYVNALQAKHIPARGSGAFMLFDELADKVLEKTKGERLFIIGFAETATAIGARLAETAAPNGYFATTTREYSSDNDYIEFSESHSHAQRQLLDAQNLDEAVRQADRIVFAEDEITTGKTVEGLIQRLIKRYPDKHLKFAVASVLNGLSGERKAALNALNAECVYIRKISPNPLSDKRDIFDYNEKEIKRCEDARSVKYRVNYIDAPYADQRKINSAEAYVRAVRDFVNRFVRSAALKDGDRDILILGSEEFMYPAVSAAAVLSEKYPEKNILTHSTTRSPIEVFQNADYPLNNRTSVASLYERGRQNFVYNLRPYDKAYVLTDAEPNDEKLFGEFAAALAATGADEVVFAVWKGRGN